MSESSVSIEKEFIKDILETAKTLLVSAAQINNAILRIERHHPHAYDESLKTELYSLKAVAADLSLQWKAIDHNLSSYELYEYE